MKRILSICAVLLVAVTAMGQNRYGIKSGSYKTEMDMMGQTITNTTYFDDYGAKEVTAMNMMGMEMTQLMKDSGNGISIRILRTAHSSSTRTVTGKR